MSVSDQRYRRWQGRPTPHWQRVLALPRYSLAELLRRKMTLFAGLAAILPSVVLACWVYGVANAEALSSVFRGFTIPRELMPGPEIFARFFGVQAMLALLGLTLVAAPRLFTPDLAGGALPLYFSKSLRRADYIAGKCSVLFVLVSAVTWLPLLVVSGLRVALARPDEPLAGMPLAGSVVLAGLTYALLVTALASAIAVGVRRAWLLPFVLLGTLGAGKAVAESLSARTGSAVFRALSPLDVLGTLRDWAFGVDLVARPGAVPTLGATGALVALALWVVLSAVVLFRHVRPVEVVR